MLEDQQFSTWLKVYIAHKCCFNQQYMGSVRIIIQAQGWKVIRLMLDGGHRIEAVFDCAEKSISWLPKDGGTQG